MSKDRKDIDPNMDEATAVAHRDSLTLAEPRSRRGLEEPRPNVLTLSTGAEDKPSGFSVGRLISAVLHRIWLAIPLGIVLAAIAVGALWYFGEDQFRSFAWLEIRDKPQYIVFPPGKEDVKRFVATQVELLRSPVIIGDAVNTPEVRGLRELKSVEGKADPVDWIKERLTVRPVGQSNLFEVAMTTREPESGAAIVTAIVNSYMNFHARTSDSQYKRMRELLSEEMRLRQRDCDLKRERLRELTRQAAGQSSGVIEDDTGQTIAGRLALLGSLQKRLLDAEVQAEVLKANIASYRETLTREVRVPDQEIADLVERDGRIVAWQEELSAARESQKSLAAGPSPLRKTLDAKVQDLQTRIDRRREELLPRFAQMAKDQVDGGRQAELQRMEDELAREQELVQYFRDKISDERSKHQEQGDVSLEIDLARVDLNHAQSIYDKISMRVASMETEARAPSQIQVMQSAKVPDFPLGTTLPKKMLGLGVMAFLLPLGLFTGYELLVKRIYDPNQIRQEVEVDFVGEVATLPVRSRLRSNRAYERQAFILEESVDSLRTALAVSDREQRQQVIVVCSAISGEGKTHLSAQLALSWCRGQAGSVLLIDADMRSPGLHEMFDIDDQPGLVEVLRGEATLQEAIVTNWGEGIHLLPAGKLGALHPDRLIASQRFARLLEVAREHYSRIIIDVPPILAAHETLLLAKMADGALLCTLRDYSRTKQIQEAHQRLDRAGVNVLGAVLNGTPTHSYVYHYGSYY